MQGATIWRTTRLNQRPFRKREGSRASVFAALERSALRPLPAERFDMSQWSRARVNIDYHIAFDGNFYSVPYTLVQQVVEIRSTPATVEIFHKGQRVASHLRGRTRGQAEALVVKIIGWGCWSRRSRLKGRRSIRLSYVGCRLWFHFPFVFQLRASSKVLSAAVPAR
jgi:hypothetical protein